MKNIIITSILLLLLLLPLCVTAVVVDSDEFGLISVEVDKVSSFEKFIYNINPFTVLVEPNTAAPLQSLTVKLLNCLSYDPVGLQKATLHIGTGVTPPYLKTIDVTNDIFKTCGKPCYGGLCFETKISLTAPATPGTYYARFIASSTVGYMGDEYTKFSVQSSVSGCNPSEEWKSWVNMGRTNDGHGYQYYRDFYKYYPPECKGERVKTEYKTVCDDGWYIKDTESDTVAYTLTSCYQPNAQMICQPDTYDETSRKCVANNAYSIKKCNVDGTSWVTVNLPCGAGEVCKDGVCSKDTACFEYYEFFSISPKYCIASSDFSKEFFERVDMSYCKDVYNLCELTAFSDSKNQSNNTCSISTKPCDLAVCVGGKWDSLKCVENNKTLSHTQPSYTRSEWFRLTPEQRISSVCSVDENCAPYWEEGYVVRCVSDAAIQKQLDEDYKIVCKTSTFSKLLTSLGVVGGVGCAAGIVTSITAAVGLFTPATLISAATLSGVVGATLAVCSGEALVVSAKHIGCSIFAESSLNKGVCIASGKWYEFINDKVNLFNYEIPIYVVVLGAVFLILLLNALLSSPRR